MNGHASSSSASISRAGIICAYTSGSAQAERSGVCELASAKPARQPTSVQASCRTSANRMASAIVFARIGC